MTFFRHTASDRPAVCGRPVSPSRLCAGLGLAGVLLVSCATAPQPSFRPPPPSQAQTQTCGDLQVRFTLSYGQADTPTYTAAIQNSAGQPPTTINRVVLAFTPLLELGTLGSTTTTLVAAPIGEGRYQSSGGLRLYTDSWQVEVIVRQTDAAEVVCPFSVQLSPVVAGVAQRRLHRPVRRFMVGALG